MAHRRIIAAVTLGLFLTIALALASAESGPRSRADSLCADAYASVQDAIDDSVAGEVVRVPVGHYTETLLITKTITLQGGWSSGCISHAVGDPAATLIDGGGDGPVVSVVQAAPTVDGLTFTGGRAPKGAGVFVQEGSATITNTVVSRNVTTTTVDEWTKGAGIYVETGAITVVRSIIAENVGEAYPGSISLGAGVFIDWHSQAVFVATQIVSNTGRAGSSMRGGGLCVEPPSVVEFRGGGNLIAYNSAYSGGGIYTWGGATVSGGKVTGNQANYGGGVDVGQGDGGRISNMIIVHNSASGYGSGINAARCETVFANNTIVDNSGGVGTGFEYGDLWSVPITLTNSIIVGHQVGILNRNETVSPTLITNNVWDNGVDYEGILAGTTDVHVDPLFVDEANGDYHLTASSPLTDAGTTLDWLHDDYDGDARPDCVFFDIGADEVTTGGMCYRVYLPSVVR